MLLESLALLFVASFVYAVLWLLCQGWTSGDGDQNRHAVIHKGERLDRDEQLELARSVVERTLKEPDEVLGEGKGRTFVGYVRQHERIAVNNVKGSFREDGYRVNVCSDYDSSGDAVLIRSEAA